MLANNIWKLIGKLFEMSFAPYDFLRLETNDSWWVSNTISWILIVVGFIGFFYWMSLMYGYKRNGKEDEA